MNLTSDKNIEMTLVSALNKCNLVMMELNMTFVLEYIQEKKLMIELYIFLLCWKGSNKPNC